MKIYTKTGDHGTTSLFGGQRVEKNSSRIEAYGVVDELNSLIGVIISEVEPQKEVKPLRRKLLRIQNELFVLGSDLASPLDVKVRIPRVTKSFINRLEREIDAWQKELPQLKNFILPGGSKTGSQIHLARTIARRAERSIVDLGRQGRLNKNALIYINRLSDWLFTLARYVNKLDNVYEVNWRGRTKT